MKYERGKGGLKMLNNKLLFVQKLLNIHGDEM